MMQRVVMLVGLFMAAIGTCDVSAQSATRAEQRLKELKITLPPSPTPVANYVSAVRVGNLLYLSGTTSRDLKPFGKVGRDVTVKEGYQAARQAGMLLLANVRANLGTLDRVKRVVKVLGMVNSADGFAEQPAVINGFSELILQLFGPKVGAHARSAVGLSELPFNIPVEIEGEVELVSHVA